MEHSVYLLEIFQRDITRLGSNLKGKLQQAPLQRRKKTRSTQLKDEPQTLRSNLWAKMIKDYGSILKTKESRDQRRDQSGKRRLHNQLTNHEVQKRTNCLDKNRQGHKGRLAEGSKETRPKQCTHDPKRRQARKTLKEKERRYHVVDVMNKIGNDWRDKLNSREAIKYNESPTDDKRKIPWSKWRPKICDQ